MDLVQIDKALSLLQDEAVAAQALASNATAFDLLGGRVEDLRPPINPPGCHVNSFIPA